MTISVDLGARLEQFVDQLVEAGTYASRDAVVRDALHLIEERERRLAELDAALEKGRADVRAGRVFTVDEVRARLKMQFDASSATARP